MRNLALVPCLIALTGCGENSIGFPQQIEISVLRLGQQAIEDRETYESLGSVSFTATQKYKISAVKSSDLPQILYMNVTQYAGEVIEQETTPVFVPLDKGEYEFECSKYVSVKPSEEKGWGPIRCEFEPLSIFTSDAQATLSKPSIEGSSKK